MSPYFRRRRVRISQKHSELANSKRKSKDIRATSQNVTLGPGEASLLVIDLHFCLCLNSYSISTDGGVIDFFFENIYLFRYRIQSLSGEMVKTAVSRWRIDTMTSETTFFKDKWHSNNNNT